MSEGAPPALAWVALFVSSTNRATDGDVVAATLEPQVDPLEWVLVLTSRVRWNAERAAFLRRMLQAWAGANAATMGRSRSQDRVFRAQIFLRGLGPELMNNPYDQEA